MFLIKMLRPFIISTLLFFSLVMVVTAHAQTSNVSLMQPATPEPESENTTESDSENVITFDRVDFDGQTLQGWLDSLNFNLVIPSTWELVDGAAIELDLIASIRDNYGTTNNVFGGWLAVEFNGVPLEPILLSEQGEQTIRLPIPASALISQNNRGRYPITITLRNGNSCNSEQSVMTNVAVRASSRFILPHRIVPPTTDLRELPRPIRQGSFLADEALLVVPDEPTSDEMQAALIMAAGFGRMAWGLSLELLPASKVTADMRDSMHLILVGNIANLPFMDEITLPAAIDSISELAPDDGVLQMVVSPWNESRVILIASSQSDAGVIKAAQAVGSGIMRTSEQPDVAIVDEVHLASEIARRPAVKSTLQDMGYDLEVMLGPGRDRTDLEFFVPPGYGVAQDQQGNFTLEFLHSALLDYERSGMVVILNDDPIGSVRFSNDTTVLSSKQITISHSVIQPGINELSLQSELILLGDCNPFRTTGAWVAIQPESSLFLPLSAAPEARATALTLNAYPAPFIFDQTLATTAFVLPAQEPEAWKAAAQIASELGRHVNGVLLNLEVAYDTLPAAMREEYHVISIGRASTLSLVEEVNEALPAPFEPDSDHVQEEKLPVDYRVPRSVDLGYLQLLRAPWSSSHTIVGIFGSSDEGIANATIALLTSQQRSTLSNVFAVVDGEQLFLPSAADEAENQEAEANGNEVTQLDEAGEEEALAVESSEEMDDENTVTGNSPSANSQTEAEGNIVATAGETAVTSKPETTPENEASQENAGVGGNTEIDPTPSVRPATGDPKRINEGSPLPLERPSTARQRLVPFTVLGICLLALLLIVGYLRVKST